MSADMRRPCSFHLRFLLRHMPWRMDRGPGLLTGTLACSMVRIREEQTNRTRRCIQCHHELLVRFLSVLLACWAPAPPSPKRNVYQALPRPVGCRSSCRASRSSSASTRDIGTAAGLLLVGLGGVATDNEARIGNRPEENRVFRGSWLGRYDRVCIWVLYGLENRLKRYLGAGRGDMFNQRNDR